MLDACEWLIHLVLGLLTRRALQACVQMVQSQWDVPSGWVWAGVSRDNGRLAIAAPAVLLLPGTAAAAARSTHQCGLEADANQVHARPVLAAARPAAIVDGRLDGLDAAAQQQSGGAPVQPLVHSG